MSSPTPYEGGFIAFQDFVVAHELLHLRVPNHGRRFKVLLSAHLPGWREYDARRPALPRVPRPV